MYNISMEDNLKKSGDNPMNFEIRILEKHDIALSYLGL